MSKLAVVANIVDIPINALVMSPSNPRGEPEKEELQELADDIAFRGVQQAITVRPVRKQLRVVFGKRRFLASILAKKSTVPAVIRKMTDEEEYELQLVENLQRKDLHPLDDAAAIQRLYKQKLAQTDSHVQAIELVSKRLSKKPDFIIKFLSLNNLIKESHGPFRQGVLLLGHAEELARLRPAEQKQGLEYLLSHTEEVETEKGINNVPVVPGVPQLKLWIQQNIFMDLTNAPFNTNDGKLNPKMGPCTTCRFKTGNQSALFPDVQKGDTCTVPECWALKRENHLVQLATGLEKELGVRKVFKIGLGYKSWNREKLPVDGYIEGGSSFRLIRIGDECNKTRPGVITFIAHPSDARGKKVGDQVFVCTDARNCSKHNEQATRTAYARPKKSYEEMAGTRIQNLRHDTKQRVRSALIKAVIQAAQRGEAAFSKKHAARLQPMAEQMHSDLFFDRHRDLCKALELEPRKDRGSKNWRATSKKFFAGNPMAMMVAMTLMHSYHLNAYVRTGEDPLPIYVRAYGINAALVEKRTKALVTEKIESIQAGLKRRKKKEQKAAKAAEAKPARQTNAVSAKKSKTK